MFVYGRLLDSTREAELLGLDVNVAESHKGVPFVSEGHLLQGSC